MNKAEGFTDEDWMDSHAEWGLEGVVEFDEEQLKQRHFFWEGYRLALMCLPSAVRTRAYIQERIGAAVTRIERIQTEQDKRAQKDEALIPFEQEYSPGVDEEEGE